MTPAEQAQKIKEIYDEAIAKLNVLAKERMVLVGKRKEILKGYIKDLEAKKIEAIRSSMGL